MKKIIGISVCMLLITIILPVSASYEENNEIAKYYNPSRSDVEIEDIKMDDYNIRCKIFGGQIVDMAVDIHYMGDRDLIDPFTINLYFDKSGYIGQQNVTKDMILAGRERVYFADVYLDTRIGLHAIDAYIDDNTDTHEYRLFRTTLTGVGTIIFPLLDWILDFIYG